MVGHRRTTNKPAFVPPGWIVLLGVLTCVVGAGWLGVLMIDTEVARADEASPTASASPTPTPTPAETTTADPTPSPTPTPEPTPEVERTALVSVLNNTNVANLANTYAARVKTAGWTVGGVGNWNGQIVSNTVYYPADLEEQGRLLAEDLDIERVMPSINPMRTDRLTIILSGPQQ